MIGIQLTLTQLRIVTEFLAKLKTFNFNINAKELSNIQIPGRLVSKNECLDLLRTLPSLKGEQFKNDLALASYLRVQESKDHLKFVLGGLDPKQSLEIEEALKKVVQEQTVAAETAGDEGVPAEQAGPATSAPSGNLPFSSMPAGGSTYTPPRRVFIAENAGGKEGGTGQGTAVTNKNKTSNPVGGMGGGTGQGTAVINKINAAEAAKSEVPKAFQNAFKDEPDYKLDPTINKPGTTPTPKPGLKSQARFTNTLKSFGGKTGRGIASVGNKWLERANPILKKAGNGLARSLSSIANPGGMGGGTGSRSLFGRLGRFGRGGGSTISSTAQAAKKGKGLLFLLGILGFMTLVGGLAIVGTDPTKPIPTTSTPPITTIGGDISSCKFTRGQENPKEATFQSNVLLGYIQEAAQKSSIPPAVLAAFIRVESPATSSKSDEEITNYAASCAKSPTGALGIMQIQPPGTTSAAGDPASCDTCIDAGAKLVGKTVSTMTTADYCDPRTSIIVGAGWILKKMTYWGYGDGTKWDPLWTNDRKAIETLVNTYYGCFQYGGAKDCTGPFNYADDVWTSVQNCQTTSGSTLPPPVSGDYKAWVKDNFQIDISQLSDSYPQWAYEVLNTSVTIAPKFQSLIKAKPTTVVPVSSGSHTSGDLISIRTGYDSNFFKQIFIHELGHRIKGLAGVASPACNGQTLEQAANEGYLTYYAEHATPPNVASPACGANDQATKSDEDFAESVSYYINNTVPELNYGSGCSMYDGSINPYSRSTEPRPAHKAYIQCLLGP